MELSRKRKRELRRLQADAETLWSEQRDVMDHAGRVAREASRQAKIIAREDVSPMVATTYQERIKPSVATSIAAGRQVVHNAKSDSSAKLSSAMAILAAARDPRVREAVRKAAEKKNSKGPGGYILLGLGIVAAAGLAYAMWQTLRADEDLWIEDEPEATTLDDL